MKFQQNFISFLRCFVAFICTFCADTKKNRKLCIIKVRSSLINRGEMGRISDQLFHSSQYSPPLSSNNNLIKCITSS
uniref:Putative secreted protein n=1 Tax=Lutzomyia longipalpis TaxID=7200 RepID=A0A7G3AM38_LUTLO